MVCENGHAIIIKSNSLTVVDNDTPDRNLVFTISSPLNFGKLVKFRQPLPHDMRNGWKIGMISGKINVCVDAQGCCCFENFFSCMFFFVCFVLIVQ